MSSSSESSSDEELVGNTKIIVMGDESREIFPAELPTGKVIRREEDEEDDEDEDDDEEDVDDGEDEDEDVEEDEEDEEVDDGDEDNDEGDNNNSNNNKKGYCSSKEEENSSSPSNNHKNTTKSAKKSTPGKSKSNTRKRKSEPDDNVPRVKSLMIPFRAIKRTMKIDKNIATVQNEAAIISTYAVELFVKKLAKESYKNSKKRGRNTVRYEDLAEVRANNPCLDFLETLIP